MRFLLDTAALLFALESPDRLSRRAASAWQNPENALELSAVSISEIAIKSAVGKLNFSGFALQRALGELRIHVLPYTSAHAFQLFDLHLYHRDPFDRQIIAQALSEDIPVITPDPKFSLYEGLRLVW